MTVEAFELTRCDVHGRYLTLGEMERGACSTCTPERFKGRCTLCGHKVPTGGACGNHTTKRKGTNG